MNKPSLKELIQRVKTSLVYKTGQDNPAIDALASAIAGASFGQYSYQDYLFQQINPETANEDWLYIWAARVDMERIVALPANGTVLFDQVEGVVSIPAGVILKTADDKEYTVTQTINSAQPVPVQSVEQGATFNLATGSSLYLVTAVTGLNPNSITSNELSGGADIEDLEHWRDRIVSAFNQRQAVGTAEDYQAWSKTAHPDIDYAWTLDNTPILGNVTVYIGQRKTSPIVSDGTKKIAQDYIDSVRLAGCHVYVQHPTTKPIDIAINGVADLAVRDQIVIALQEFINDRLGLRTDITPSEIMLAITPITVSFGLTAPASIQTLANNELFTLGNITWA